MRIGPKPQLVDMNMPICKRFRADSFIGSSQMKCGRGIEWYYKTTSDIYRQICLSNSNALNERISAAFLYKTLASE